MSEKFSFSSATINVWRVEHAAFDKSLEEEFSRENEPMVGKGEDRFNLSSAWSLHKGCGDDCEIFGVEKSITKGAQLGNAYVDLFYKSRGKEFERGSQRRTGESQGSALEARSRCASTPRETGRLTLRCDKDSMSGAAPDLLQSFAARGSNHLDGMAGICSSCRTIRLRQ